MSQPTSARREWSGQLSIQEDGIQSCVMLPPHCTLVSGVDASDKPLQHGTCKIAMRALPDDWKCSHGSQGFLAALQPLVWRRLGLRISSVLGKKEEIHGSAIDIVRILWIPESNFNSGLGPVVIHVLPGTMQIQTCQQYHDSNNKVAGLQL